MMRRKKCNVGGLTNCHEWHYRYSESSGPLPADLMGFPKSSFPVEKALHHPLRLAGQEGFSEHADAEIDGFGQRQFLPLMQQCLLRSQGLRPAFEQRLDGVLDR